MTPDAGLRKKALITAIEITRRRLPLDPPFRASWDIQPRMHFDAAIVRVHTDLGVTSVGLGDMMRLRAIL